MSKEFRILAINPGATSTKLAVYANTHPLLERTLRHSDADLAQYKGRPMLDQFGFRSAIIESELELAGFELHRFDATVGRGGLLRGLPSGTYLVNQQMLEELRLAERGDHASNLGAPLANAIAAHAGCKAYIVDPVSVDEWEPIARLSGTPLIERPCLSHALNTKATAKRYARDHEKRYEDLRLVVAHIGSGNTVSAHRGGRMIDATNSREEGAFSALRAGAVPAIKLIELCETGDMSAKELERALVAEGGLKAYLGTSDLVEVEKRIDNGDEKATLVFEAMAYQIAKDIGAMATVLNGEVDAVLITGGMAFSARLTKAVCERVE
ncbi:MAG TPA: butyrate kinase, partial [Candidatus Acidoferrales bacterium]|nr:butyrate kinase [Candidatus Acidoferrales bacterium]